MSTKSFISKTGYYNNSQKKTNYTKNKTRSSPNISKTKTNNKSSNRTITDFFPVSDPIENSKIQNQFDSKMLNQPILNINLYQKTIESQFPSTSKEKMKPKLLQYNIIIISLKNL